MAVFHRTIHSMNSCIDVVLTDINENTAIEVINLMEKVAHQLENILSCYNPLAEVYKLNHEAIHKPVNVSDTLWEVIIECIELHKKTQGFFNFGLKNLFPGNGVNSQTDCFDLASTLITGKNRTVQYASPRLSLDFGAVGKGYVLRDIANILNLYEIKDCLISFGGSSFLTRGSHPHGDYWPISLRHTYNSDIIFAMKNHAASISSTYNEQGNRYHIINPFTLHFVTDFKLAFVQGKCPVVCEVLSTALTIMPLETVREVINFFEIEKAVIFKQNQYNQLSIVFSHGERD